MRDQSAPRPETAFDPFGEPVTAGVARACPGEVGDRAARRVGGAVFWGLALLILAGRVYATDVPTVRTALAQAAGIAQSVVAR